MLRRQLKDTDTSALIDRALEIDPVIEKRVRKIVETVRQEGDTALLRYTQELDQADLDTPFLPQEVWDSLAETCPSGVRSAIDGNLSRIKAFHALQVAQEQTLEVVSGVTLGRRPVPHRVAACYVPGGRASYPSTVLMTVPLARLAGVERVVVVTPPRPDGTIDPAVAYAAKVAGATDILRCGGAQAIAAVTYGAGEKALRADCIVGPGNAYVTAAKRLVADRVWTDAPAGPSELLVLADDSADPKLIAADMVAQAEHDPDAQCILVTDSWDLADAVAVALERQAVQAPRAEIIQASLADHGAILVTDDMEEAVAFADSYAPEHLEVQCRNAQQVATRVRNAGSIFIGPHAPVPLGDYGSGTNHVLPTMGYARIRGGLSVDDFRKWITWQEVTEEGLAAIADDVTALADAEGLHGHADAIRIRREGT